MRIIRTQTYKRSLKKLGATAAEIEKAEAEIAANPLAGDVIPGVGVRKVRFAMGGKGKSGGGRAIYYVISADDAVAMILAYSKSDREDLSNDQRKLIIRLVQEL